MTSKPQDDICPSTFIAKNGNAHHCAHDEKKLGFIWESFKTSLIFEHYHLMAYDPDYHAVATWVSTRRFRFWRWLNEYSYDKVMHCD
jgi:hypothetical protein